MARDLGREHVRKGFEAVFDEQAAAVEKKGRRSGSARGAVRTDVIADGDG